MLLITNILLYFFIGLFWQRILISILEQTGLVPPYMSVKEATITILIWPISFGVFIFSYILNKFSN